jgi:hypothetical protein
MGVAVAATGRAKARLIFVLVFAIIVLALSAYGVFGTATAVATVTAVQPQTNRREYDATFVAEDGQRCQTRIESALRNYAVPQFQVGDVVDVRYSRWISPCFAVTEDGDDGLVPFVCSSICIVATLVGLFVVRRRRPSTA